MTWIEKGCVIVLDKNVFEILEVERSKNALSKFKRKYMLFPNVIVFKIDRKLSLIEIGDYLKEKNLINANNEINQIDQQINILKEKIAWSDNIEQNNIMKQKINDLEKKKNKFLILN